MCVLTREAFAEYKGYPAITRFLHFLMSWCLQLFDELNNVFAREIIRTEYVSVHLEILIATPQAQNRFGRH